ncbi:MAG: helix-turn-helix domain-containing protein [Vicinamibacterales bacterium]
MSTVTGRAALFTGGTTIDPRQCAEIGAELNRRRTALGLTLGELGEKLLLSPRQVVALEQVDLAAFHNATFYMSGLRKYAALAGLDPLMVERAATTEPLELVPGHAEPLADVDDPPARRPRTFVAVAVAIGLLGAVVYMRPQVAVPSMLPPFVAEEPPGTLDPAAAVAPVPFSAIPGSAVPLPPPPSSPQTGDAAEIERDFGSVRVPRQTWLFVRYSDDTVVERQLAGGETAVLQKEPVFLAVGVADAELTVAGRRVNVVPFVVDGQLRVEGSDLHALLQRDDMDIDAGSPVP